MKFQFNAVSARVRKMAAADLDKLTYVNAVHDYVMGTSYETEHLPAAQFWAYVQDTINRVRKPLKRGDAIIEHHKRALALALGEK